MKRQLTPFIAAAAAFAIGSAVAPATYAQTTPPKQAPANYSEKDIQSFVVASHEIRDISEQYRPQLEAAKTAGEKEQVRQEAVGKMTEAVQKNGLTVEKFNEISAAAKRDPSLAAKIKEKMNEAQ